MLEGAYSIKTGEEAVPLSTQQILDCVMNTQKDFRRSKGCKGGLVQEVLNFCQDNYLNEEKNYPYRGRMKECRQYGDMLQPIKKEKKRLFMDKFDKLFNRDQEDKTLTFKMNVKRWFKVQSQSPQALKKALTMGPVSLTINANNLPFMFYFRGIIKSPRCSPKLNHAVLAVGYGVEKPKSEGEQPIEYIIIKNSWGKSWGEGGYVRISMSKEKYMDGYCGIFRLPYLAFVEVEKVTNASSDGEPSDGESIKLI